MSNQVALVTGGASGIAKLWHRISPLAELPLLSAEGARRLELPQWRRFPPLPRTARSCDSYGTMWRMRPLSRQWSMASSPSLGV
jgi:hypothetical protein